MHVSRRNVLAAGNGRMKSLKHGKNTSRPEVTNLTAHGFGMLISAKEYFVPFEKFPWFKDASVGQIMKVELLHEFHLYWPDLDVDLSLEIIEHPDKFRLVSK